MDTNKSIGTSDMPVPPVINYRESYIVTPLFKKDLAIVLSDTAYVDAIKFFDIIDEHNSVFPAAILHEFIESLKYLPYRVIAPMISILNNKDKFNKYFTPISQK